MKSRRIRSVARRGEQILTVLQEVGPMSIADLCIETGLHQHQVRYAAGALVSDDRAHIQHYDRVACSNGVEHEVAFYAAGKGENAELPRSQKLDFTSTGFIQDIYMGWAKTRYPPILEADDELS